MNEEVRKRSDIVPSKKRDPAKKSGSLFCLSRWESTSTYDDDIRRLQTLRTLGNFKFDLVAFIKRLKTVSLNGGEVNEHVVSVVFGNKSEALLLVKPLYTTSGHYNSPPFRFELG
jgi:hypothetical protein